MSKLLLARSVISISLLLTACAAPAASPGQMETSEAAAPIPGRPTTLSVFAAASLAGPFTQAGEVFEQANPNLQVVLILMLKGVAGRGAGN